MPSSHDLSELLACPRCDKTPLRFDAGRFSCSACRVDFPDLDGIPCLFADPPTALADWRSRLDRALKQYEHDAAGIGRELDRADLPALTRARLKRTREAYLDQTARMRTFMAPLEMASLRVDFSTYLALRTRMPSSQGLHTYYSNVHRDWVWGDEENEASRALVADAAGELAGNVLVLGAGAGRLAYDLHQQGGADVTLASDFNPFLMLLAQRLTAGANVELYEFPMAPRTAEDVAVLQTLAAPAPAREGFHPVLGDALRPPFAAGGFDVVVTPWLIDILPEPFAVFSKRINALLRAGGRWINFGSLAFSHAEKAQWLTVEETVGLLPDAGFAEPTVREETIPYMCSPHSHHGRRELVVTFGATKEQDVKRVERHTALPEWLVKGEEPVPLLPAFQTQAMTTRIYAFIMAMIDGKRTLKDMARLMAEQRLMTAEEAEPALRGFLTKMYEESRSG